MSEKDPIIRIRFHPGRSGDAAFTFEPDVVHFHRGARLELQLATDGEAEAKFSASRPISFKDEDSATAFEGISVSPDGRRLALRNRGGRRSRVGGEISYGYHVTVDYDGAAITSGGYPAMNEHEPPP